MSVTVLVIDRLIDSQPNGTMVIGEALAWIIPPKGKRRWLKWPMKLSLEL
jgi:hypothetical protein